MTQNSREILERMSLEELSISKVPDFQLSILLKKWTLSQVIFKNWQTFEKNTLKGHL